MKIVQSNNIPLILSEFLNQHKVAFEEGVATKDTRPVYVLTLFVAKSFNIALLVSALDNILRDAGLSGRRSDIFEVTRGYMELNETAYECCFYID